MLLDFIHWNFNVDFSYWNFNATWLHPLKFQCWLQLLKFQCYLTSSIEISMLTSAIEISMLLDFIHWNFNEISFMHWNFIQLHFVYTWIFNVTVLHWSSHVIALASLPVYLPIDTNSGQVCGTHPPLVEKQATNWSSCLSGGDECHHPLVDWVLLLHMEGMPPKAARLDRRNSNLWHCAQLPLENEGREACQASTVIKGSSEM